MKDLKLLIAGEGGQGVQTIAQLLAETAALEGEYVTYIPNFGVEQRGGVSLAFVQISQNRQIEYPKFSKADILVVLCDRAIPRTKQYLGLNTIFVYDSSQVSPSSLPIRKCDPSDHNCPFPYMACNFNKLFALPAFELSKKELDEKVFNVMILGAVLAISHVVKFRDVESVLDKKLEAKFKKNPKLKTLNEKALKIGINSIKNHFAIISRCNRAMY